MNDIKENYSEYFKILRNNKKANYLKCKYIPVNFNRSEKLKDLWYKHDKSLKNKEILLKKPEKSLLDLKIEIASRIFENCTFCERKCKINRNINFGKCNVKIPLIASEFLHYGEENLLVPSYTIFFSGCNFHCVFCQNWDISQNIIGEYYNPNKIKEMINYRSNQGAKNVNWVGGDPTPNILYIIKILKKIEINIPQIWNSNMYCSKETLKLLNGLIDLYLTDFKYGNDNCALRLSKIKNYYKIVKRNHLIISENAEVLIRHLILPNHIECCTKPLLKWISENLKDVSVNIMFQYHPSYKAYEYKEISKPFSKINYNQIFEYIDKLKLSVI